MIGNRGAHHVVSYISTWNSERSLEPIQVRTTNEHLDRKQKLEQLQKQCSHCWILETGEPLISDPGKAMLAVGDVIIYYDDDHVSESGAVLLFPMIKDSILTILGYKDAPTSDPKAPKY